MPLHDSAFYSMFFMEEARKGAASDFAEWINVLPENYNDHPINYSESELELL